MPARFADDRGETLLETLVATVLLGLAVVAVLGSLLAAVQLSDVHRKQADAGAVARDYAETVNRYVAAGGYASCAGSSAYLPAKVGFTSPKGYTAVTAAVRYWTGSTWTSTCSSDIGLQLATVQARSVDGRATEEIAVVLRKPCGQGSTC
jgi:type II secretory pathway pseudopilin PulG